jgi:hypothetical protein
MPKFKLNVKKVIHGYAEVDAKDLEEAKKKFENGEEKYFEDFSKCYPVNWEIKNAEMLNEEIDEWEEI